MPPSDRVLVSACLLGERVRYDGRSKPAAHPVLQRWLAEGRVVSVCPEVFGGLPVPRPPAEQQPDGRVVDVHGADRTQAFRRGAERAVAEARSSGATVAVLKKHSPSCGRALVHDGSFSDRLVPGEGVAAKALREAGVQVFDEDQWDEAAAFLAR
jgi:uncharacterized protein YbbK (DUF523 family)